MTDQRTKRQIARALFDSPVALLHLAESRADELRLQLGYSSDDAWIAVFDFVMAINALRDWTKALRPELELELNRLLSVETIDACRDIANAGKHVCLEYMPTAMEIRRTEEVAPGTLNACGNPEQRTWRLVVLFHDGSSRYLEDMADDAVRLWQQFFSRHEIA